MTLQTRFVIMIIALFVLMYSGAAMISAYTNHEYMQQQLRSNADDTASSLGLILSQQGNMKNRAKITAMIDAVFDRGYFQSIQLKDMSGKLLVDRQAQVKVYSVPDWFVRWMSFESPKAESLIMDGWRRVGSLTVQSHPGYAYEKLWSTLMAFLMYCLLITLIVLVIGLISIHAILRPVRAMAEQAQGIIDGHFPIIKNLPKPYRLRKTVKVMNRMSRKLKHQFEEQREVASRLRKMVYHDSLTGLNNQLYFVNHLKHDITYAKTPIAATVMLIEIDGVKPYNYAHGYQAGDALLVQIGRILQSTLRDYPNHFLARLYGVNFGIMLMNTPSDSVESLAKSLSAEFSKLSSEVTGDIIELNTHIGIIDVQEGIPVSDILSAADAALSKARGEGDFNYDYELFEPYEVLSDTEWRQVIEYIIEHMSFQLEFEACYRMHDHEILFHEVLMHAHDEQGHPRRSRVIYSMAERFGLASQLDKMIIKATLDYAKRVGYERDRFAINLSMGALDDGAFIAWLKSTLIDIGDLAEHLFFEVTEYAAVHHLDMLKHLTDYVRSLGSGIAIDHFGRATSSFAYMRSLDIEYVKLDASFIRNIEENEDNVFYITSLVAVAHSLDIPVLVDEVETEAEYRLLKRLKIDAAQGIYFENR